MMIDFPVNPMDKVDSVPVASIVLGSYLGFRVARSHPGDLLTALTGAVVGATIGLVYPPVTIPIIIAGETYVRSASNKS